MEIVFIRHAESLNNEQYFLYGNSKKYILDPPLSELGERQAAALADFLTVHREEYNFDHIFISPMQRAMQTAYAFAHLYPDCPKVVWPWIYEGGGCREVLSWEPYEVRISTGMSRSQILQRFPNFTVPDEITEEGWYFLPGIETKSHLIYRAFHVIEYFINEFGETDQKIALVSHGDFHNHFMHAILRSAPQPNTWFISENTAMTEVGYHKDRIYPSNENYWFIGPTNHHEWLTKGLERDWSAIE